MDINSIRLLLVVLGTHGSWVRSALIACMATPPFYGVAMYPWYNI